ncbi:MAG TPA: hypothetical protein VGL52_10615, partial [Casimicrobiaceae bacterium]
MRVPFLTFPRGALMKTIVGSFDSFDEANQVARELMDEGFRDSDVSVVASNVQSRVHSGTGTSSGAGLDAPADTSTGFTNDTGTGTMQGMGPDTMRRVDATTNEHYTRSAADNALTEDGAG